MTLLEINDLKTYYNTDEGQVHAVDGVSLELEENETLGFVGESGSGKTTLARSINQVLSDNAEIVDGEVIFEGVDLTELSEKELREYRWEEISLIPQNAMNALDPVYTIQEQIVQVIRTHRDGVSKSAARERAAEMFELVGLDENRLTDYPHQFSGGMKQRALIALALALEPKLVLADEPTTALDVIIQKRILERISQLQDEMDLSMILVTHDISVVSETCDRIAVFYGGHLVEYADARSIIKDPRHPYTMGLQNAFPSIEVGDQNLISIPGEPPDLTEPEDQCLFAERCPFAEEECFERAPERREIEEDHYVECHYAEEKEYLQREASKAETWSETHESPATVADGGDEDD